VRNGVIINGEKAAWRKRISENQWREMAKAMVSWRIMSMAAISQRKQWRKMAKSNNGACHRHQYVENNGVIMKAAKSVNGSVSAWHQRNNGVKWQREKRRQ
jgi:hypothetical protein